MELLLSMTPVYLLGNFHCMGMCGPLVMLLGKHPFRMAYFVGRLVAFLLAGMLFGEMGAGITFIFQKLHVSAFISLLFALLLLSMSLGYLTSLSFPRWKFLDTILSKVSRKLSLLLLKENMTATFLFGLSTILLPCGQSWMVFSISALLATPLLGALNGLVFALMTTPSLWLAMKASCAMLSFSKYYKKVVGGMLLVVAGLTCLRGLADLGIMDHLVLSQSYHIVLY